MYVDASERFAIADRVVWQKPAEVIAALHVRRGDHVLDVGTGSGDFAIPLARAAGHEGLVWAIDREPAYIQDLEKRLPAERASNVRAIVSSLDAFEKKRIDLALLSNTLHQMEDPAGAAAKLFRIVKPKTGRVAIIDWKKKTPNGPPESAKISDRRAISIFTRAGFTLGERLSFLPQQFFLIFSR